MSEKIKLPKALSGIVNANNKVTLDNWTKARKELYATAGLYAFWWAGDSKLLERDAVVKFVGPAILEGENDHSCSFVTNEADRLIDKDQLPDGALCLYVGKSTNIQQRISQHLMPGTRSSNCYLAVKHPIMGKVTRTNRYSSTVSTVFKRNSSSQFRAGMEYLFRHRSAGDSELVWNSIKANVFVTQLPIVDNIEEKENASRDAFKRRFYGEDLLIGLLQPWFNLDGER